MLEREMTGEGSGYEKTESAVEEVRGDLTIFLNGLSPRRKNEGPDTWLINRTRFIGYKGEDSIAGLVPKKVECSSHFLTRALNNIHNCGVMDREDLIEVDVDEMVDRWNRRKLGKKTKQFATLLQNLAVAEQYLDWNSN